MTSCKPKSPNQPSENEVTPVSDPIFENSLAPLDSHEHDLPIAIRKGTRECTKHPLYPLSHFVIQEPVTFS